MKALALGTGMLTVGLLISTPLARAVPTGAGVTEQEFVEWIGNSAINVDRWQMNPELEAYLDKALASKKIVFIAEPGHFFTEKYDVQRLLIRDLVKRGYRHIFLEGLGASMAPGVDEYVQTGERPGEGKADDQKDDATRYRERAFMGWKGAKNPEFGKRTSAEQVRFFAALHEINASLPEGSRPLRVHALDIDMIPGGCSMSIERILEAHADDPQLDPVHELATKRDAETVEQEIGRLERLRGAIKENRAGALNALTPEERANLARYADCLVESIAFFRTAREDGVLDRALVRREPAMFRQVEAGVESMAPGEKAIMIAHCNHLCRVGADTLRARNPSLGEMIEAAHPGEVFSIWMLYDHGAMLNPMNADLIETLESDPERVEHAMAKAGSTYLLPLGTDEKGERYLAQPRNYSYFTWFETGTLTKQTDALFFLDVVSPLHE